MKRPEMLTRCAVLLTLSVVAGCASSGSVFGLNPSEGANSFKVGRELTTRGTDRRPSVDYSWVAAEAKTEDLLYVGGNNDYLSLYAYPKGRLVGVIKNPDFLVLAGECVDGKGDVFVSSLGNGKIFEYAHGSKKLIQTLDAPARSGPVDCAVDPITGDLAVTSLGTGTRGNVAIYPNAQAPPKTYNAPQVYYYFFCGYDNKGNLFIDGQRQSPSTFQLAELTKGNNKFVDISLNQTINWPGSVLWDGKHLAVGDQAAPEVYEFDISGSNGTLEHTTPVNGVSADNAFWIQRKRILVANGGTRSQSINFFTYPAGGNATKIITRDVAGPGGLTVSLTSP